MKPFTPLTVLSALLAVLGLAFFTFEPLALAQQVESLRGGSTIPETIDAPTIKRQDTSSGRFQRAYRQQPPLIPHRIDHYQIDLRVNKCLSCHDWPFNVEQGAPKISETHYNDREGKALDHVNRGRWFCTQCHVTQANAKPLVANKFKSAIENN